MSGIQFDNGGTCAAAAAVAVRAGAAVDGLDALSAIPDADEGLPPISPVLPDVAADGNVTDGDMTGGGMVDNGGSDDDDGDDDDETVKAVGITSTGKTEIVLPQIDPRLGRGKRKDGMARLAIEALASETGQSMASGSTELRWLPWRQRARSCPPPASTLQKDETLESLALYSAFFSTLERDVEELRMALSAPSPRGGGALETPVLYSAFFSALERDIEALHDALSASSLQEGETLKSPVLDSVPSLTFEQKVEAIWREREAGAMRRDRRACLEWVDLPAPFLQENETLKSPVLNSVPSSTLKRDAEAVRRGVGASLEWDDLSALSLQEGETLESPVFDSVHFSTPEEDVQVVLSDVECGREWEALCATWWP